MLSRPASLFAAAAFVTVLSFTACQSTYSNVYSFKKNSFVPPPKPVPVKPKDPASEALPGSAVGAVPGAPDPGLPGLPGATPAPAAPGVTPPATGTIPGL